MISANDPFYQDVARQLEALILDRTLLPGSKIPSERQLAQRLSVSRPVVREALKELRGRGIIETQRGRGSFVSEMLPAASDQSPLRHLFRDHSRAVYDLLEVRELLEGQSAFYAALRLTPADRYRISKAYEAMDHSTSGEIDVNIEAKLDHNFHQAISEATHNPFLAYTLRSLSQLLLDSVITSVNNLYHRPEQRMMLSAQHHSIFVAIMDHKPDEARAAAVLHIQEIRKSLQAIEMENQRLERAGKWELIREKQ